MLKKYRNSLLELIRANDINPLEFTSITEELENYSEFRIQVVKTSLYFAIRTKILYGRWQFAYLYSKCDIVHPRPQFPANIYWSAYNDFEYVADTFKDWLNSAVKTYLMYRTELEEDEALPDLWAELSLSPSFTDTEDMQNSLFSFDEQKRIVETLNEFVEEIQERAILSEENVKLLTERIDYLVEASKRLGRKDWLTAALGAIMGYTLQASLSSDVAIQVIHLAGEALRWIEHNPLLLP